LSYLVQQLYLKHFLPLLPAVEYWAGSMAWNTKALKRQWP
jgi:hypothetical protein